MRRCRHFLLSILVAQACFCLPGIGQPEESQNNAVAFNDIVGERSFGQLQAVTLSPNGAWIAYAVQQIRVSAPIYRDSYAETGVPPWAWGTDIWVTGTETGKTQDLTQGDGNNWLPAWSPDGRYVAFLSDRNSKHEARLWLWNVLNNSMREITEVRVRTEQIEWSPDSRNVFVTAVPADLSGADHVRRLSSTIEPDQTRDLRIGNSTVTVYRAIGSSGSSGPVPGSDPWNLNRSLRDIVSVDVGTGLVRTLVHGKRIETYRLSPDGSKIAYTVPTKFEKPGSQQILFDIGMSSTGATCPHELLLSNLRLEYGGASFSWSPDGGRLGVFTGGAEERIADGYIIDIRSRTVRNITSFPPGDQEHPRPSAPVWDSKGSVYFVRNGVLWRSSFDLPNPVLAARVPDRQIRQVLATSWHRLWATSPDTGAVVLTHDVAGKEDGFYRIDLATGHSTKLLENQQCYTCMNLRPEYFCSVTDDSTHAIFFAEDALHGTDLWVANSSFSRVQQVTHLNLQLEKYKMGSSRLVEWTSDDGEPLKGALLLPAEYSPEKRYRLLVWLYGGASLSDRVYRFGLGYRGPFNLQMLATRDYAVLAPDAPQHLGTPMLDLIKSVLPGVNKVIDLGIADPNRVVVMGHSFGGYSTVSLITLTNRFKCAIELEGFADLVSAYGQMGSDGSAYQTAILDRGQGLMGGTPWDLPQRYVENSPIFHFDRIQTPLLIVHGAKDDAVAPFLGDEIFVALRRVGRDVEYAKYDGEGHIVSEWSYWNQLDLCRRLMAWLNSHLPN